jgi:hypothetical protein
MTMTRVAYVTTANTGLGASLATVDGMIRLERADPHGVVIMAGGQSYRVDKASLPDIGRFFFAAALALGVDINAGWDGPQDSGLPGGVIL